MTKACSKCGLEKPLEEFYERKDNRDGRRGECKACTALIKKQWKTRNPERVKEKLKEWKKNNPDKVRQQARKSQKLYRENHRDAVNAYARVYRKAHPEMNNGVQRRWRETHREQLRAHQKLEDAVYRGKIIKPSSCPRCGSTKHISGHHHDYSKPYDVEWLCHVCHMKVHYPSC